MSSTTDPTSCTVFYSWQSDLPNATNRGFIQRALEAAAKTIREDQSLTVEPVIDRDTAGVPGAPDIGTTIFEKIDQAAAFVCDVSITNREGRPSPNPNVLVELGYAWKALGPKRVLMVMNTAFGGPELLPFDLRLKRVTKYEMPADTTEKSAERRKLEGVLAAGLRDILVDYESTQKKRAEATPAQAACQAIRENRPDQQASVRRFMLYLVDGLKKLDPRLQPGEPDENLVQAIAKTVPLVQEFAVVAETVAEMNAEAAALALYKSFEHVVAGYDLPPGFTGPFRRTDFDFYKFIGHELVVTFFAFMLREGRWDTMRALFEEEIFHQIFHPTARGGEGKNIPLGRMSDDVALLDDVRNRRLGLGRVSVRADLLKERHTQGPLATVPPFNEFMDADYFLFLRSVISGESPSSRDVWRPWSSLYIEERVPRFLVEALSGKAAARLCGVFGVDDIPTLRLRLSTEAPKLEALFTRRGHLFFRPLEDFDWQQVGAR